MRSRTALMLCTIAACTEPGRPLERWTLDAEGRSIDITLPRSLDDELGGQEVAIALRSTVDLEPGDRGQPVTLTFDGFGVWTLAVEDVAIEDVGDVLVGEHRFVIPASLTTRSPIAVTAATTYDWSIYAGGGIRLVPRLEVGSHPRTGTIANFNRSIGIASVALVLLLGSIFAAMYLSDRTRRESLAAAAAMTTVVPTTLCWQLGLLHPLGLYAAMISGIVVFAGVAAFLPFMFATFELGKSPRGLLLLLTLGAAANLANLVSLRATQLVDLVTMPVLFLFYAYMVWVLARVRAHRYEAGLFLAMTLLAAVLHVVEFALPGLGGPRLLGGLRLYSVGGAGVGVVMGLVLARQHVMRRRALQQTTEELRHQVSARSRDLARALARLQTAGSSVVHGTIAGRYRIVRYLGAGGMGTVYEVERISSRQRLALKTLRTQVEPERMARFAREAQIAAGLQHPNLLPVLDVGLDNGVLFFVMPFMPGGTLEDSRSRFGDAEWARPLLRQIASGLAALHGSGIVHRDLKPANILLSDRVARIADFGLATMTEGDPLASPTLAPPLTRSGAVFGTPRYMAPELADGVARSNTACDVFAFGLIACELLAGRYPFTEQPIAMRSALPPAVLDAVDLELRPLVARCLDGVPDRRPTAAELVAALT